MKWKYYIPTIWKENERRTWEDVWLMPDNKSYCEKSILLTIESPASVAEFWADDFQLPKIGADDFYIDGTNIIVGVKDFGKQDILEWAKVWLKQSGFPITKFVKGTIKEFQNTNVAKAITQAVKELKKIKKENPFL